MIQMANLRNRSILLTLLCTFLINGVLSSPVFENSVLPTHLNAEHSVIVKYGETERKKRATDEPQPQIEDLPTKLSIDDPEVTKYIQLFIDKYGSPASHDMKAIIKEIEEATSYPPSGKLLYKIKFKLGSTNCTKGSDEQNCEYNPKLGHDNCEISVYRETDIEPSMTIVCSRVGRRRRAIDGQPEIADLPIKLSTDDPEVKKYVQMAVDKHSSTVSLDMKAIIKEIVEATSYPPSGKLLYNIKFKLGSTNCTKESDEQNCEYNPEAGDANCEIDVYRVTDMEPSIRMMCSRVGRRRRAVDGELQIPDLPLIVSTDDPEVKKYTQMAVDKYGSPSSPDKKAIIKEINEATSFNPSGKLLYKIKFKMGTTNCAKESEEQNCVYNPEAGDDNCEINVSRETDKEPSMVIECFRVARRRRAIDGQLEVPDLPLIVSTDDPEVKKYAQMAVDKYGSPILPDMKAIVKEINEAISFNPSGKLLYKIKFKIGTTNCTKESEEQNCVYNPEAGDDNCEINVSRETDKEPSMVIECFRVARRRRATDSQPRIADLPSKSSVNDPQVKKYAQRGIEMLSQALTGPNELILEKILEATFYPPAGKLLYKIKIEVANKQNKANSQKCTVNVWRESGAEPSVNVVCGETEKKKRAIDEAQPQILDKPIEQSVDDPEIKKFAAKALEEYAKRPSVVNEPVLINIKEAIFYPPAGKLLYTIKMEIGTSNCPTGNKDPNLNCEIKADAGHDTCTVDIWRESDKEPSMTIECTKIDRKRRHTEHSEHVMDKPLKMSIDEPEIKKLAQKGVEMYAESSTGPNEPILEKIEEALMYPPVGTLVFEIKIKIGMSTCAKGQKENCELKAGGESKSCTVYMFMENDKPRTELKCN